METREAEKVLRALREQAKPLLLETNAIMGELDQAEQRIGQARQKAILLHD